MEDVPYSPYEQRGAFKSFREGLLRKVTLFEPDQTVTLAHVLNYQFRHKLFPPSLPCGRIQLFHDMECSGILTGSSLQQAQGGIELVLHYSKNKTEFGNHHLTPLALVDVPPKALETACEADETATREDVPLIIQAHQDVYCLSPAESSFAKYSGFRSNMLGALEQPRQAKERRDPCEYFRMALTHTMEVMHKRYRTGGQTCVDGLFRVPLPHSWKLFALDQMVNALAESTGPLVLHSGKRRLGRLLGASRGPKTLYLHFNASKHPDTRCELLTAWIQPRSAYLYTGTAETASVAIVGKAREQHGVYVIAPRKSNVTKHPEERVRLLDSVLKVSF
jgi:hypothetical protein